MYKLGLMGEAVDDLAELDPPIAQRILDKSHRLADNFEALTPQPLGHERNIRLVVKNYQSRTSAPPTSTSASPILSPGALHCRAA